jgi:hypothetical protein
MAKAKTKKSFQIEFYANMNWFDVAEQPAKLQDLPDAFAQAKKLSKSKSLKNQEAILALLRPYVRARFLPENLAHSDSLFSPENGAEVEAADVRLVAVDFSSSPIPKCKAEAHFNLRLVVDPGKCDFDAWQEENSNFYDAVAFYWEIERNEQTEDLDFTFGDHQGVECIAAVHPHAPAAGPLARSAPQRQAAPGTVSRSERSARRAAEAPRAPDRRWTAAVQAGCLGRPAHARPAPRALGPAPKGPSAARTRARPWYFITTKEGMASRF